MSAQVLQSLQINITIFVLAASKQVCQYLVSLMLRNKDLIHITTRDNLRISLMTICESGPKFKNTVHRMFTICSLHWQCFHQIVAGFWCPQTDDGREKSLHAYTLLEYYTVSQINVPLCDCPYLRQILTDFQNFFTGTFCGQVAVVLLLNIPTHLNCVSTLPCETLIVKNV